MHKNDEIYAAVSLLQSLGVHNLCHDGSEFLESVLPSCEHDQRLLVAEQEEVYHITSNVLGALGSVLLVALISGLFLGLLTLDVMDLQIIIRSTIDENERTYATNILPVVKDRHRLLVTLLIVNALAYESLPLFLDNLVPSWVAVLMSTTLILVFGEILPSGIFMGPNQLYLGSMFIPSAKFFLWILYPVAVPLARCLDYLTETNPHDETNDEEYNRRELTALIQIQHERRMKVNKVTTKKNIMRPNYYAQTSEGVSWSALKEEIIRTAADEEAAVEQLHPPLHQREVDMLQGALGFMTQTSMDVYTPYRNVYAVPDNLILDKATIMQIYSHGYSRVPVYRYNKLDPDDQSAVLGFLITRQLMLIDWDDQRCLSTLPLQRPVCVRPGTNLVKLFETLQTNGLLLTFVCANPMLANKALQNNQPIPSTAGLLGIVTLVDVMESLLKSRIYDESDIRDRDRAVAVLQQWASTKLEGFVRRYKLKRQLSSTKVTTETAPTVNEDTPLLPNGKAEAMSGAKYTVPRV